MLEHAAPTATRTAALDRLKAFLPDAGRAYADLRNYDLPEDGHPHVSQLSPYLRHRLITEPEVLQATLNRHSAQAAEKFIQEVCWRTYWKGWLELRPTVWGSYRKGLDRALADADADLRARIAAAEAGETEIDAFNAWARELVETGYLHNHARMWFASIWIFTLRLPWEVGADFFLRHLLDGDPASNTLGWRWVAGIQTQGKHYLARSSNISKFTKGRHNPEWRLNTQAEPLKGGAHPDRRDPPRGSPPQPGLRTGVLVTEDDLSPGYALDLMDAEPAGHAALISVAGRSPRAVSPLVTEFTHGAVEDCLGRYASRLGPRGPVTQDADDIVAWATDLGLEQIVTPYAPVGPAATRLRQVEKALDAAGIALARPIRDWDAAAWPHATHGFFRFKGHIPDLIAPLA